MTRRDIVERLRYEVVAPLPVYQADALHSVLCEEAAAEIERLQAAKRRALAIADERAKENVALRAVADAARKMPRWTPKGGGCTTKHTYQIEASDVWALDRALTELDAIHEQSAEREVK